MTRVTSGFAGDRFYYEISGHACVESCGSYETSLSSETSEDGLVCAAVSILVLTAAERIALMESEGAFYSSSITIESGYCCFDLEARDEYASELSALFDLLTVGFQLLEENYPQHVSVE